MEIFQQHRTLFVKAPAKLNLYLEVLGLRPDGYHELETVMQTVSLYDELALELASSGIRLVTSSPDVPQDRTNLAVRAAELLCHYAHRELGATIRLEKRIPVGAGMGGGSSDAAAALVGLNRLWNLDLKHETLHELAARLGSDVPFFLCGGTALCRGRGDRITRISGVKPLTYVVVWPRLNVSTKEVYGKLPPDLTKDLRQTKLLLREITKEGSGVFPHFFNRLESVTVKLHESLALLARRMTESGLAGVTMTGSGSAFFGVSGSRKEADESLAKLSAMGVGEIFVVESTHGQLEATNRAAKGVLPWKSPRRRSS
jgi:4-diphosphocytidyl-2-C-methyl-D-erythritol kinase